MMLYKNKQKKLNHSGFSMVELLASLVILGIVSLLAIKGVTGMISRARTEKANQQEKTLAIATESFIQANTKYKPKNIGQVKRIPISLLKQKNYLKDDIKNANGESCMNESYVRVYKVSKNEYSYLSYLYCGSETKPAEEDVPNPVISIKFSDGKVSNKNNLSELENVSRAHAIINIKGCDTSDTNLCKEIVPIDGYKIVLLGGESRLNELYDSGTLSANRNTDLTITFDLSKYIDISKSNSFSFNVSASNIYGGSSEKIYNDSANDNGIVTFKDNTSPYCIKLENEAKSVTDWINKASSVKERKIRVHCDDADGSGCVKETFTRTWPDPKYQKSTDYGYIQVEDNAGNYNYAKASDGNDYRKASYIPGSPEDDVRACRARVFVDRISPDITIKGIYKDMTKKENYLDTDKTDLGQAVLGFLPGALEDEKVQIPSYVIPSVAHKGSNNGWLKLSDWPNGAIYEFEISDDYGLASYTFETSTPNISLASWNSVNEKQIHSTLSSSNDGAQYEVFTDKPKKKTIHLFLGSDHVSCGERAGVLTVYDVAGNPSKVNIEVSLDPACGFGNHSTTDSSPSVISIRDLEMYKTRSIDTLAFSTGDEFKYDGSWVNVPVIAVVPTATRNEMKAYGDNAYISYHVSTDAQSFEKFKTLYGSSNVSNSQNVINISTNDKGKGNFQFEAANQLFDGISQITYQVCFKSGTCSAPSNVKKVKIDTVAPRCGLAVNECTLSGNGSSRACADTGKSYSANTWVGNGKGLLVKTTCDDSSSAANSTSGCDNSALASKFYEDHNGKAGSVSTTSSGEIVDNAGNKNTCSNTTNIKVDNTKPTCSVVAKKNNSSNYNGTTWINSSEKNAYVRVSATCNALGGSPCKKASQYKDYSTDIDTTNAGPSGNNDSYNFTDQAGNKSDACAHKTVKIDKTAPTCGTQNPNPTADEAVDRTINLSCTDGTSGCKQKTYTKSYFVANAPIDTDDITIYDNANNSRDCTVNVKIKKNAPTKQQICQKRNSPEYDFFVIFGKQAGLDPDGAVTYSNYVQHFYSRNGDNWGATWCQGRGNPSGGYVPICINETKCGDLGWYGLNGQQINAILIAAGCTKYSNFFCNPDVSNGNFLNLNSVIIWNSSASNALLYGINPYDYIGD